MTYELPPDMNCPYCDAPCEVNHDDGEGYAEDQAHQHTCSECDKTFVFHTSIHFSYEAQKADCLNGAEHDYKPTISFPIEYTRMVCRVCEEERRITPEELDKCRAELEERIKK